MMKLSCSDTSSRRIRLRVRGKNAGKFGTTVATVALVISGVIGQLSEARTPSISPAIAIQGASLTAVDIYRAFGRNKAELATVEFPDPKSNPFLAKLTLRRIDDGKSPLRIVLRPATVLGHHGNSVVVIDEAFIELSAGQGSEGTAELRVCHLGMLPWQTSHQDEGITKLENNTVFLRTVCGLPELVSASNEVRQAVIWLAYYYEGEDLDLAFARLCDRYSRTSVAGTVTGQVSQPFKIDQRQWLDAYRILRPAVDESHYSAGRGKIGWLLYTQENETQRAVRERRAQAGSAPPAAPWRRPTVAAPKARQPSGESVTRKLREAQSRRDVSFEIMFPEPESKPYDAQWTLRTLRALPGPTRVEVEAGTIFTAYSSDSVVCLEGFSMDAAVERGGERTGSIKVYIRNLSRQGIAGFVGRPGVDTPEKLQYLCTIPDLLTASDSVRQAAIWGGSSGSYRRFYSTLFTAPSGEHVTRPNPYRITEEQWAEAKRITKVVTPARRQAMDLAEAEVKLNRAESARARREAEERELQAKRLEASRELAEAKRIAERKTRTTWLSLQEALGDGLLTASVEALVVYPEKVELRLDPTAKLGNRILKLEIPGGTVLRETGGQGRTGYLGRGELEVEGAETQVIRLICLLHDLDDAGPGDFAIAIPDPLVALMLPGLEWRLQQHFTRSTYGSLEIGSLGPMLLLIHGDQDRTVQHWQEYFGVRGLGDPYASITRALKTEESGPSPEQIHELLRLWVFHLRRNAEQYTTPEGSTYPVTQIVGRWHVASKKIALQTLADAMGRRAEETAMFWETRKGTDPPNIELAIKEAYEYSTDSTRQMWQELLSRKIVPGVGPLSQQEYRFDITFKADHTFEVTYEYYDTTPMHPYGWRTKDATGIWTWNGLSVVLHEVTPALDDNVPSSALALSGGRLILKRIVPGRGSVKFDLVITRR